MYRQYTRNIHELYTTKPQGGKIISNVQHDTHTKLTTYTTNRGVEYTFQKYGTLEQSEFNLRLAHAVVENYAHIIARKDVGDFSGMPYLDEFERATVKAKLTDKQADIIEYRMRDYTYKQIAEITGRKVPNIQKDFHAAVLKIAQQIRIGAEVTAL